MISTSAQRAAACGFAQSVPEQRVHVSRGLPGDPLHGVAVRVERHCHRGVPEHVGDHHRVRTHAELKGGRGVSQIVEPHARETGSCQQWLERPEEHVRRGDRGAVRCGEHEAIAVQSTLLAGPVGHLRGEATKGRRGPDRLAAEQGELGLEVCKLLGRHREVVAVEHREVS